MAPNQRNRSTEFLHASIDRRTLLRRTMAASLAVPVVATAPWLDEVLAAQSSATPSAQRAAGTPVSDAKQVLRIAVTAPFRMDPPTNAAGLWALQSVVFMALGRVDATNKIVPGVADSWTSTADKSSWTFKLNPKAAFSDGTPITADDVKWTWEWYSGPKSKSLGSQTVAGTITGWDAVNKGTAETMEGIVVEDPQTITFKLTGPDPMFLAKAAVYSVGVLKRDNVEKGGEEWWRTPVTSGMFKVSAYTPGDSGSMTLERNEHWWRNPAKLSRVEYKVVSDVQTQLVMYQNGEVDTIAASPAEFAQAVKPGGDRHDELVWLPVDSTYYFGFFCNKAPFDDPKVRQAFAHAIDRNVLSQAILGGMYAPQTRILSPRFPCGGEEQFQPAFDVAKAKQLLSETSYGSGDKLPKTTILVSEPAGATATGVWGRMAEAIQQQLEQNLGVKIDVVRKVYGTFAEQQAEAKGLQGGVMFRLSFGIAIYDPSYMTNVVHSTPTGNVLAYNNPAVDKLLDQAAVETDETKRCEMYTEVDKTVSEDAVFAAPFRGAATAFFKPNVRGIQTVLGSFDASVDKIYIAV